MNKDVFNNIWSSIVKPEIDRAIYEGLKRGKSIKLLKDEELSKDLLFSRYHAKRAELKGKAMLKPGELIDRHKIAALFYEAFVYKTDKYEFPFIVFDYNYRRQLDADMAVTHSIAFDISLGILESFILSDTETQVDFKSYIEKNGLIEPQIICKGETNNDGYEKQTIKQLIFAQKENKLSVLLLANIFYSIENNSRLSRLTLKTGLDAEITKNLAYP